MEQLVLNTYPDNTLLAQDMFILGLIHDIGYAYTTSPDNHSEIGGMMLKDNGYKYWQEVYYHGKPNSEYSSFELTILNKADLLVGRFGNDVGINERLKDVMLRYGEESVQYKDFKLLAEQLKLDVDNIL